MKTKSYIWVTFKKEGIHCYPAAPEGVEFLRYPHRHIFHIKALIEVFHDDRDLEFILLKRELENLYSTGTLELDSKSCEMIARELGEYLLNRYPDRYVEVEVSEDGENGCLITFGDK